MMVQILLLFERDFTLGALHGILAFEKGGITVLSAQNTRALIPFIFTHCAMVFPSYVRDSMSGEVQAVPILRVVQKLWLIMTCWDN